ncbi:GntR family transcriptional regulator [Mycetocola sp. 2940]|uniref:GntR family transcriptional regulator n=1 Tax=Mycetocola sp. 2940 TaxID=3156452 RepID=UPI00339553F5
MDTTRQLEIQSVEDAVHQALRDAILTSELVPGNHLHLASLADQFGVSTMPVRGAIRRLATEGLVQTHPRRGAVVSELSISELDELHDLRIALETTVVRIAVLVIGDQDLDRMRTVLAQYETDHTPEEYQSLEWTAFLTCYEAAGRERTVKLIIEAAQLTDRYAKLVDGAFDLVRTKDSLARLIAACETRDRIEAERAVLENLRPSFEAVRAAVLDATRRSTNS